MPDQTLGFTFREKMAGGFSLGETDPQAGAKLGTSAGNTFTMHATITIADLNRFLADANHPGAITGSIDFPPLGLNLPSTSGIFNLFSPSGEPKMKYMVYEIGFNAGGRQYYMAGRKEVKEAAITNLWKATTTLYTQLHEGNDKSGPVIGAGVLTLGMEELMAMIPTMQAINAKSVEEAASAMARFGKFFLGELWDTYVKRVGA
jgi:hypothetical protein